MLNCVNNNNQATNPCSNAMNPAKNGNTAHVMPIPVACDRQSHESDHLFW